MAEFSHTVLGQLADFAAGLDAGSLPAAIRRQAKGFLLDALSAAITSDQHPRTHAALAAISHDEPGHRCHIVGSRHRAFAPDAALVNGVATAATGRMDTDPLSAAHPGTVVVPAVLAAAEHADCDGATVLAALVAGYEVMCRLGGALLTPDVAKLFRPTSLVGPTSAAIGAARALNLPHAGMVNAAALATHTAVGFNEWAHAGTSEGAFQSGLAARNGVSAALLGAAGARAAASVLEGPAGLFAGHGRRMQAYRMLDGLGHDFRLRAVLHKPVPACIYVQTPCQLAQQLLRSSEIDVSSIASIQIGVSNAAAGYPGCDNAGPIRTQQEARMSIQFSVAAVLVAGGIIDGSWSDTPDPAANALAARARVIVDDSLSKPGAEGAWIDVRLADGRKLSARQDDIRPLQWDDLQERFLASAAPVIGRARAEQAVSVVQNLENAASIFDLTRLLAPAGPS